jgi:hypothetical protein
MLCLVSNPHHRHNVAGLKRLGDPMLHQNRSLMSSLFLTLCLCFFAFGQSVGCAASGGEKGNSEDAVGVDFGIQNDLVNPPTEDAQAVLDTESQDVEEPAEVVGSDTLPSPEDADNPSEDVAMDDLGTADTGVADTSGPDDGANLEDAGGSDKPKSPVQKLCENTDGAWDEDSCGHWVCGEVPLCAAIIPGCNCGEGKVFDGGQGCVASPDCGDLGPDELCVSTGGDWLEGTCGDWICGEEPLCEAIIPGCNCGKGMVFDAEEGCIASKDCDEAPGDDGKGKVCVNSGGMWLPATCGDWKCGNEPLCKAIIPGCNCGPGQNFDPVKGCFKDPGCEAVELPKDEDKLCIESGGSWLLDTCGHWECGKEPLCDAIIPGCNCGPKKSFDAKLGCVPEPNCGPIPVNDPFKQCVASGGKWDATSCAHWACGVEPKPCAKPNGGCNCGEGMVLVKEHGCLDSLYCDGAKDGELCTGTGGDYLQETCGHASCGKELQNCAVKKPGCNCGDDSLFFPQYGCNTSKECN